MSPGLLLLLPLVKGVLGGCRWSNPAWLQSLDSAPQVNITADHLLTVGWSRGQFADKFNCADKFDVGVEHGGVERRLCSKERTIGLDDYACKLNLNNTKHCGQKFSFWVSAVNLNHTRGAQIVNSFANTVLTVKCGADSEISQVLSTSCLSMAPAWLSGPNIIYIENELVRFEWDRTQLTNPQCADSFMLKLWEAASFSPRHTTMKISMTDIRDTFGGNVKVASCKSYTYILSAITETGTAIDIQGELKIPCPGEGFSKQLGDDFDDRNDIGKSDDRSAGARSLDKNVGDNDDRVYPDLTSWQGNVSAVLSSQNSAKMLQVVREEDISVKSSADISFRNIDIILISFISFVILEYF